MNARSLAEVGAIVKARRLELQMTPSDLCQAAQIDPKTLQKLEEGVRVPQHRTRLKIEPALNWAPGSLDKVLDGGDPIPIPGDRRQNDGTSQPAGRVVINLDKNDGDVIATLDEVLQSSELPASAQAQLEGLRDDVLIRQFPSLYDELSRGGKLKVAHYGQKVRIEEQESPNANPSSDATQPNASAKAGQDQEAALVRDLQSGLREMADRVEANPEQFGVQAGPSPGSPDKPKAGSGWGGLSRPRPDRREEGKQSS